MTASDVYRENLTQPFDQALLNDFSSQIAKKTGLHFPQDRWPALNHRLSEAREAFGFKDLQSFLEWLQSSDVNQVHTEMLAGFLTVGETYFYRDKHIYQELEEQVFPGLLSRKRGGGRKLRIWSAGCSSGEEPYSLAMLLYGILPDYSDWNIQILATDINQLALSKAAGGVYKEWSFRGTPPGLKKKFFEKTSEGAYRIDPELRRFIHFRYLNLAQDPFPSLVNQTTSFDLIFCRNVMIYFQPELNQRIIRGFHRALNPGGWLLVGGSEGIAVKHPGLLPVRFPTAIFYRKETAQRKKQTSTSGITKNRNGKSAENERNKPEWKPKAVPSPPEPKKCINMEMPAAHASAGIRPVPKAGVTIARSGEDILNEAEECYRQEQYVRVIDLLNPYIEGKQEEIRPLHLLARSYANLGKMEEAQKVSEKIIKLARLEPDSYLLKALLHLENTDLVQAMQALSRAIYLDPGHILAQYTMGSVCLKAGKAGRAGVHLQNASDLLNALEQDEVLPGPDRIRAGRLSVLIASMQRQLEAMPGSRV